MSDITFESLFEGKQHRLEKKIYVDDDLLGKLQEYGIITEPQRSKIEASLLLFARLNRIIFIMHDLHTEYYGITSPRQTWLSIVMLDRIAFKCPTSSNILLN